MLRYTTTVKRHSLTTAALAQQEDPYLAIILRGVLRAYSRICRGGVLCVLLRLSVVGVKLKKTSVLDVGDADKSEKPVCPVLVREGDKRGVGEPAGYFCGGVGM